MEEYQRASTTSDSTSTHAHAASGPMVAPSPPPPVTVEKADVGKRVIAFIIDAVIAFAVGLIPIIGGLVGAAYMMVRDGLDVDYMRQRSVGKHLMGLRPVRLDGQPMTIEVSIRRNWMFGLGAINSVLVFIPILGWALMLVVGLAALVIGLYELYRVVTDPEGRRWGDQMANTRVIETEAASTAG